MYYAIVDSRSSTEANTMLLWGSLKEIAEKLIEDANNAVEYLLEDMDEEELEEEYGDDLEAYFKLINSKRYTKKMIENFSLYIDDTSTEVAYLVDSYSALVEAFDEYVEDKMWLSDWSLVEEIEETEEVLSKLSLEMWNLSPTGEYEYFVQK